MKETPWEGGVRGVAALWSPLIQRPGRVVDNLMHMTDWLPTLASAAGLNASALRGPGGAPLDGVDQWAALSQAPPAAPAADLGPVRDHVLHNIDDVDHYAAVRQGNYKYVIGEKQYFSYSPT